MNFSLKPNLKINEKYFFCLILFTILLPQNLFSTVRIGQIFLERKNVFDSTGKDWFFAAPIANALHTVTKKYLIEDEFLFEEGDDLNEDDIAETERNLRSTGLFTNVKIYLDSVNEYIYNVIVTTQDKWSTMPSILYGTGGNAVNWGGRIEEDNLLGNGTQFRIEALHRTENNIDWQGTIGLFQRRIYRTELSLQMNFLAHKYRTDEEISIFKPFRTLSTNYSYGITGANKYGYDFLYSSPGKTDFMSFHEKTISGWLSRAWQRSDKVFATMYIELKDIYRGQPNFRRAYDNTGKILIAFSSVSQDYIKTKKLNQYQDEDLPIGGWGTAVLGKTFALGPGGDNLYYVGAQGEKSYFKDNIYLFGQLTGASGFTSSIGVYTYQEFLGLGFYKISESTHLAARIHQQTVWNWYALRQLILDNEVGLRGYPLNSFSGDNRFIGNFELRTFPNIELWILKFGGALFYDFGTVWRQQTEITKTQWHSSAGFGFRFQNMKTTGATSIFRIDFAFNFDQKRFGSIIFTTDQLFSVFKKHEYSTPQLYGLEFDDE